MKSRFSIFIKLLLFHSICFAFLMWWRQRQQQNNNIITVLWHSIKSRKKFFPPRMNENEKKILLSSYSYLIPFFLLYVENAACLFFSLALSLPLLHLHLRKVNLLQCLNWILTWTTASLSTFILHQSLQ